MSKTINQEKLNGTLRFLEKQGEVNLEMMRESDPATAERVDKLVSLFKNEEFDKQLVACSDNQAVVKLFAENGVEMTEEDAEATMAYIKGLVQKLMENDGELSEEELEMVAGGWSGWGTFWASVGSLAFGGFCMGASWGTLPGMAIGVVAGAVVGAIVGLIA